MASAYVLCGDRRGPAEIYATLLERWDAYVAFSSLAIVAAGLGRHDEAVSHLEKALEEREPALAFLKSLPWFAETGRSPRFQAIVRAVDAGCSSGVSVLRESDREV
jgi:hypothetical protein